MKQRFSTRELEEKEEEEARARGLSNLSTLMKVISRGSSSSSTTPPSYHNSLLMNRSRLPDQPSSSLTITELSNLQRRTELHKQVEVPQSNLQRRTELHKQVEVPQQQQQARPTSSNNRMYTCKTCGRQFETFQALGGHRASHKIKLVGPGIVGEDGSYQHFQYKEKLHRCSICDKGYHTGQALGGHMRKHRELLENQRLAAAAEAASNAANPHQNAANHHQSNALRWAQMNAAAIFQYSNHPAQRYNNAPHPPPAEVEAGPGSGPGPGPGPEEGEILMEKVPTRRGINFDLNLDISENEELGLGTAE